MPAKRAIMKLLLLLLLSAHVMSRGFTRVDLPTNFWESEQISEYSMLGCSLQCSIDHLECHAFSFQNGTCKHGTFQLTQASPSELVDSVFLVNEDATTWLGIQAIGVDKYQSDFLPPVLTVDNHVYAKTKSQGTYNWAKSKCSSSGAKLINDLYKPAVWEMMKSLYKGSIYWVNLQMTEDFINSGQDTCLDEECTDMLLWGDGTFYSHTPPMECISAFTSSYGRYAITLGNCSHQEGSQDSYILEQTSTIYSKRGICKFPL